MNQLLYFLLILGCPLMMIFMMRGMHGGGAHNDANAAHPDGPNVVEATAQDARIADLEHEVARLREARVADDAPDPEFVEHLHRRLGTDLVKPRR